MRHTYTFLSKSICRLFSYCRFLCAFNLSKCFRNKCKKYLTYRSFYQLAKVFSGRCSIKTLKICLSAISIKTEFCGKYFPVNFSETFKTTILQETCKQVHFNLLDKAFFYLLERLSQKPKSAFTDVSH